MRSAQECYMLEIDGVKDALAETHPWFIMTGSRIEDDFLAAIDAATDPAELQFPDSYFRRTKLRNTVHFLRVFSDQIMPFLQHYEDNHESPGVKKAFIDDLDQLDLISQSL